MENASKALLFAGGVLLALLIIGLAMSLFNSIRSSSLYSVVDEQNLRAYNRPFDTYDGDKNVSGSNLKTLFAKIQEHNLQNSSDSSLWINVHNVQDFGNEFDTTLHDNDTTGDKAIDNISEYNKAIYLCMKMVWTGKDYEVLCSYDSRTGRIVCIQFKEAPIH
jgi:hypothetical protein